MARPTLLLALALSAGCDDDPYAEADGLDARDFYGQADSFMQFGPSEAPAGGPFLMMHIEANSWALREGEEWANADDLGSLTVDTADGLVVDGQLIMPATLEVGAEQEGVEVLSLGEEQVYYGIFPLSVRTSVPSGRFQGEQIFARDVGPAQLVLDGETWELVYYQ